MFKILQAFIAKSAFFLAHILVISYLLLTACTESENDYYISPTHKYIEPNYQLVQIRTTNDTLHFPLDENTFNSIESFNLFTKGGKEFISFFDQRSLTVSIYQLQYQQLYKKISIKQMFRGRKIYKTSVFVMSEDSIFVNNDKTFYSLDSTGMIRTSIKFLTDPRYAWATFQNNNPAVLKDEKLYASVRPYVDEKSLNALKDWRVLYEFDLKDARARLCYPLPDFFRKNIYNTRFLEYSFCFNDRGNFVFSFSADSSIYETDLHLYHKSYSGKSQFQYASIPPMSTKESKEESSESYMTRDSYGSIYFDPTKKRYLRISQGRISHEDYIAKKPKEQRILILDENFRIIGESAIPNTIALSSLFISKNGGIYARVQRKDEYAIHFIRLNYVEEIKQPYQIASDESNN